MKIFAIIDEQLYSTGIDVPLSIDDLVRRNKLAPLKVDAKNKLFYRKDIEQRKWE